METVVGVGHASLQSLHVFLRIFEPKGSMQEYGIYLGPKVVIWEPLWPVSIDYIAPWSLWVKP